MLIQVCVYMKMCIYKSVYMHTCTYIYIFTFYSITLNTRHITFLYIHIYLTYIMHITFYTWSLTF